MFLSISCKIIDFIFIDLKLKHLLQNSVKVLSKYVEIVFHNPERCDIHLFWKGIICVLACKLWSRNDLLNQNIIVKFQIFSFRKFDGVFIRIFLDSTHISNKRIFSCNELNSLDFMD